MSTFNVYNMDFIVLFHFKNIAYMWRAKIKSPNLKNSTSPWLVLQNRTKSTIDYRIESAAHNRLYNRFLQLKGFQVLVFIHHFILIPFILRYITIFTALYIYSEYLNYIVTCKCCHLLIFSFHLSALVDSLIPIQIHVHFKKNEWIDKSWFHSWPFLIYKISSETKYPLTGNRGGRYPQILFG